MDKRINYIRQAFFVSLMALLWGCGIDSSVSEVVLNKDWNFKKATDTVWNIATVPGTVHTDLITVGKIEAPYYRLNEHKLQWIDKEDWDYKTNFSLTRKELSKQHIDLEFLGLDTYAKIYLNDSLLLETDNMFRTYTRDVKSLLKEGSNELYIRFDSPIKRGTQKYDSIGYKIPVSDNDLAKIGKVEGEKQVSIYTRKAGYHFGWIGGHV